MVGFRLTARVPTRMDPLTYGRTPSFPFLDPILDEQGFQLRAAEPQGSTPDTCIFCGRSPAHHTPTPPGRNLWVRASPKFRLSTIILEHPREVFPEQMSPNGSMSHIA